MMKRVLLPFILFLILWSNTSLIAKPDSASINSFVFSPSDYGCFTERLFGDEELAKKIKSLNFRYVVLFTYFLTDDYLSSIDNDIDILGRYGIGVILYINANSSVVENYARKFSHKKNLVGWYVYDEPTIRGITQEEQDNKINVLKSIVDLPCFTSECGNGTDLNTNQLSDNYDYVFSDVYVPKVSLVNNERVLNSYALLGKLYHYSNEQILPVYESYWDVSTLQSLKKNLLVKKSLFVHPGAFFIFSAEETQKGKATISNNRRLRTVTKKIMKANPKMHLFQFSQGEEITSGGKIYDSKHGKRESESKFCFKFKSPVTDVRFYYVTNSVNPDYEGLRIRVICDNSNLGYKERVISLSSIGGGSFIMTGLHTDKIVVESSSDKGIILSKMICVGISQ